MRRLRPIDGLVYACAVLVLALLARCGRERADAPPPPPPVPGAEKTPIDPASPFASAHVVEARRWAETTAGTAFSVDPRGVWVTARHVVAGCRQPAIVVAEGRGVAARVKAVRGDVAVLVTQGGAPALPLAPDHPPEVGQIAFHPGFPQGQPGEVASRFLAEEAPRALRRDDPAAPDVWAWAEVGRTEGVEGSLAGLSGAPALNAAGQVVALTLAEAPRRGRVYTTTADTLRQALAAAGVKPATAAARPMTADTYGEVADGLRRALQVTQAVCLSR